ncbi:hypothetical protein Scep_023701 [Stephania cephalantha]|uniref:Uncharacterized protein n=1 Tax=Stephania cephalantha TaxID=152367 RepID=A0AAP0EW66_9MAGN
MWDPLIEIRMSESLVETLMYDIFIMLLVEKEEETKREQEIEKRDGVPTARELAEAATPVTGNGGVDRQQWRMTRSRRATELQQGRIGVARGASSAVADQQRDAAGGDDEQRQEVAQQSRRTAVRRNSSGNDAGERQRRRRRGTGGTGERWRSGGARMRGRSRRSPTCRGGAQLFAEEPSPTSMALDGYGLGSSFMTHYIPLRIASISRTKFQFVGKTVTARIFDLCHVSVPHRANLEDTFDFFLRKKQKESKRSEKRDDASRRTRELARAATPRRATRRRSARVVDDGQRARDGAPAGESAWLAGDAGRELPVRGEERPACWGARDERTSGSAAARWRTKQQDAAVGGDDEQRQEVARIGHGRRARSEEKRLATQPPRTKRAGEWARWRDGGAGGGAVTTVARLRRRRGERRDGVVGPIGGVTSTKFDDARDSNEVEGHGCYSQVSGAHIETRARCFEDDSRFLELSLQLLLIEWVHWQVSHGYCYLRYESVRAGRQGSRPKHEVCGRFIVVRARAGRRVSRLRSGLVDIS